MRSFGPWRRVHRGSSFLVAFAAFVHLGVTFVMHDEWGPDALWFFGSGVGLLSIAVMNLAHVGTEPCSQPTAPVLRWLNWMFAGLGLAALVAVPEPQAIVIAGGLLGQALAGLATLPGPRRSHVTAVDSAVD